MDRTQFLAQGAIGAFTLFGRHPLKHPTPTPTPTPAPTPPPPTGTAPRVGFNTHFLHTPSSTRRAELVDAAGLTIRESMSPGNSWTDIDGLVADVKAAGATLVPVLKRLNNSESTYANWCRTACDRYGWPIFEIDNEPWNPGEWSATPAAYASECRAVMNALRGSTHVGIVSADLVTSAGAPWFQPLLDADPTLWANGCFQGWAVHPYCNPFSPLDTSLADRWRFNRYELILSMADNPKYNAAGRFAYLTEFGWHTTPPSNQQISESTEATYYQQALAYALANNRVQSALAYKLDRPVGTGFDDGFCLYRDATQPKPALAVIKAYHR